MNDQHLLELCFDAEKETRGARPGDGVVRRLAAEVPRERWRPEAGDIQPAQYSAGFWSAEDPQVLALIELYRSHDPHRWRIRVFAEAFPYRNKTAFRILVRALVPLAALAGIWLAATAAGSTGWKILLGALYVLGLGGGAFILSGLVAGAIWHVMQVSRRPAIERAADRMRDDVDRVVRKVLATAAELKWDGGGEGRGGA